MPPSSAPLDLKAAAERIGVHYQTAYGWARNGRLPATVVDGRYSIEQDDLRAFIEHRRRSTKPSRPGAKRLNTATTRMHTALTTGDEATARAVARSIVDEGTPVIVLIEQVLVPPLRQIGQAWSDGQLSIWAEHRASGIVERILGDVLPRPRGRRRGTAVVAALAGDRHSLATTMAAVALRENNWHVHDLGADTPSDEIVDFVDRHDIDVAVLTVVNPECGQLAESTAATLRRAATPTIVGGPGRTLDDLVRQARAAAQ